MTSASRRESAPERPRRAQRRELRLAAEQRSAAHCGDDPGWQRRRLRVPDGVAAASLLWHGALVPEPGRQRPGRRRGRDAELAAETVGKALIRHQRAAAVSGLRQQTDQLAVGALVERIEPARLRASAIAVS